MNLLLLAFLSTFINQSHSNVILDAVLQTLSNIISKEEILKLNLTRTCSWQVEILFDHQDIVFQMFDASSKFPYSGILDSGRVDLGNFDECLSIDSTFNDVRILGKYCYAGLVIPDVTNISNTDLFYKLATCTPHACSNEDLVIIADYLIPGFPPLFIHDFCTTKENGKDMSFGTIMAMYIFFLILFLMFMSTMYDIYCYKMEKTTAHPLLLAFSVFTNTKHILNVPLKRSEETIQIFNGFRVISVAWIIAGHGAQSFASMVIPAMNTDFISSIGYKRYSFYLFGAQFAVTTFFFMSGFLMSYLYLKRKILPWKVQLKSIPLIYLHRYIRLTTSVLMIYILVLYLSKQLSSGPLWISGCQTEIDNCKKYWWSYFLYIQNYVNWDQLCLVPLWYLCADMQLFVLAPLVLIPMTTILKSKNGLKLAMLILGGLNLFFVILNIGIKLIFPSSTENSFDTHSRFPDYFIGIMMGIFMRFTKDKRFFGNNKLKCISEINLVIWIIVLSGMFTILLFYEDAEIWFNNTNKTVYIAFSRMIWSAGLCWMVYSCYHGYGGIVNWILCRPLFEVGAKLSYSMYLLHYLVLGHYSLSNRMKFHIDNYIEFYLFCGYFIESLIWSFLWTLAFESPMTTIANHFFNNGKNAGVTVNNIKKTDEETCV